MKRLLFFVFLPFIQTASITPNYKSACTLISTRIYCYSGGYASLGDVVIKRALDEHHYLDLSQTLILDETSARWISIPDDSNYINEPTLASTSTSVTDSTYIIDGGYNDTPFVKNISRLFDTRSNTWSTISNDGRNLSNNAIYMGTAVSVPSKGRIYYWGGLSGQYPGYPVNTTTVLTTKSPMMYTWSVCPGTLPLGTFTRFGHTATLDNEGINIYYLGGRIRTVNVTTVDGVHTNDNTTLIPYNIIPMNKILSYNTNDATWSARDSPSAPTMSSRYMHTANLLPYSGKILIYGGATDDGNEKHPSAVSDYLYLFDPKTLEYTRIEEYEQSQGAGPRFGHSAILCNNTLFVLFGVNQKGLITNDVYFLSLTNSATWLKSFSLLGGDGPDNKVGGTWLSNQAITGITIGSVLFIIILLIGSIYMIHTTRSKKKKLLKEQEDFKQKIEKDNNNDLPQLHKQYQRYSTVDSILLSGQERYFNDNNNNNIPNEYDTYVISSDSITLHDNNIPPRGFSYDHLVLPSAIHVHKPNQVKDQQPLTFIEGQQQQSSTGSFFLQPTTPVSNTTSVTPISLVKPSV